MAFPKAVQVTHTEEYLEHLAALLKYKQSCSDFSKIRKFKNSLVPKERLMYYDAQRLHSEVAKQYHKARDKYKAAQIMQKLRDKGVNLEALELAQVMNIKVPASMQDLLEAERADAIERSMTPKQRENITKAALEYMNKSQTAKEQFLAKEDKKDKDPLFGDFEPLGDSSDES